MAREVRCSVTTDAGQLPYSSLHMCTEGYLCTHASWLIKRNHSRLVFPLVKAPWKQIGQLASGYVKGNNLVVAQPFPRDHVGIYCCDVIPEGHTKWHSGRGNIHTYIHT